ncbi:MAG: O-antigen ligase family protein [Candidatus Eisenbacteria bacterium]
MMSAGNGDARISLPSRTDDSATRRILRHGLVASVLVAEAAILLGIARFGPSAGLLIGAGLAFVVLVAVSDRAPYLAVIALMPFSRELMIPGTGSALQAPTEPMLFVVEGVWLLALLRGAPVLLPPRRVSVPAALIIALAFASCLYTAYPAEVFKSSLNLVWYALFGLALTGFAMKSPRDLGRFAAAFSIPGALVSAYYLINIVGTGLDLKAVNAGARPFFAEHGTFGAYLGFALPMAVVSLLRSTGRRGRHLRLVPVGLIFAALVLCMTRAAWVGLLAALGTTLILATGFRRVKTGLVMGAVAALLIVLLAALASESALSEHARSIVDTETNVSNLERINRYAAAVNMFRAHPVGGVGFGAYPYHYHQYRRISLSTTESGPKAGAHNIYLSVLSENGVVGLAVFLLFLGGLAAWILRLLSDCRRAGPRARPWEQMIVGLAAGLAGYAVHGIFNHYPSIDKVNVPIWTFIGALAVCGRFVSSLNSSGGGAHDAS